MLKIVIFGQFYNRYSEF